MWGLNRQRMYETTTHKGVEGQWVEGRRGGMWFRPVGWRPKMHLADDDAVLCRGSSLNKTENPAEVTCGSCLNIMTIRRFRLLMILIAALVWANSQALKAERTLK